MQDQRGMSEEEQACEATKNDGQDKSRFVVYFIYSQVVIKHGISRAVYGRHSTAALGFRAGLVSQRAAAAKHVGTAVCFSIKKVTAIFFCINTLIRIQAKNRLKVICEMGRLSTFISQKPTKKQRSITARGQSY